ncbi:hypothetical protein MASR2M8_10880 [Opitutaceae bacterium]
MTLADSFTILSSAATAIGVVAAAYQIRVSRIQSVTEFEDGFAKEYRELASRLPVRALLGAELSAEEKKEHFDELVRYIDLNNEQIFLRQVGRVRQETWLFWRDGMKSNLEKAAFRWAWNEVEQTQTSEFSEFRRLVASQFKDDPCEWKRANGAVPRFSLLKR